MSLQPLLVLVPVAFSTGVLLPLTRSGLFTQCTLSVTCINDFFDKRVILCWCWYTRTLSSIPAGCQGSPGAEKNCYLTL